MSIIPLRGVAALVAMAGAAQAATYTVDQWPGDIDTIPCSAWTHMSDGTWALKGSIKLGASVIEDIGVKGDAAARALDKRCGK
jgi:hypothetical protein